MANFNTPSHDTPIPVPDLSLFTIPDELPSRHFRRTISDVSTLSRVEDPTRLDSRGLRDLMTNYSLYGFEVVVIIDARFGYEYEGGHIKRSWNICRNAELRELYEEFRDCNACVVFHCEFSQDRGPKLMNAFRDYDRQIHSYPTLSYPFIFLLEGGYRQFYEDCRDMCTEGYVEMRDPRFVEDGSLKASHSLYIEQFGVNRRVQRSLSSLSSSSSSSSSPWMNQSHEFLGENLPRRCCSGVFPSNRSMNCTGM
jgi:M-phase inducer tyrosine phosphatase